MKTYAIQLIKGGVGKTTITGMLGFLLSQYKKKKVLLIDSDPQGSLTTWLVEKGNLVEKINGDIADVLYENKSLGESVFEVRENLFVLPCYALGGKLKEFAENKLSNEPFVFKDINNYAKYLEFDYVLYDLSPGFSRLEKEIVSCVDEIITPLTLEILSIDGIEQSLYYLEQVNKNLSRINFPTVNFNKIIINKINKSFSLHNALLIEAKNVKYKDFHVFEIGQNRKIADAQKEGKFVFEVDKNLHIDPFLEIIKEL